MLTRRLAGRGFVLPLLALAAPGQAQAPQPAERGAAPALTARSFAARQERRLLARDADGDGRIGRSEFLAGAPRAKGDPAARFAALDRNNDGALDRAEIATVAARRFARLDKDGNGLLSPTERVGRARSPDASPTR